MTWRERAEQLHEALAPWPRHSREAMHYLALALCGEAGELANLVCKRWRGDVLRGAAGDLDAAIEDEVADVAIYLHLLSRAWGIDIDRACDHKTRANEARRGRSER